MKLLYRHSDFIICVAKGVEQYVMTLNVKKNQTTVIYNPIDIETVEEGSKKSIIESGNFISFCGRLSPIKNIDLLINGFEIFLRGYPDYKLFLIGGGTEEKHPKQLVKEKKLDSHVFFIGSVPNPHCYVARSQALVLSSYSEAFPMVICEAFVTGTTVVSTPSGGPNELLENGRGYLLKSFQDAEEMAETIAYACEHPIDPQLLKDYVNRFDDFKIAQQYIKTFGRI